jgi:sugar lactone lactonase YvrE
MGVQVFDRNGRVRAILSAPNGGAVTSVCIGGPNFDTLYTTSFRTAYQRKLKVRGWPGWAEFITLPPWGAG